MSELKDETFKKNVNFLLNLEQQKYKISLSLYINKLNCFKLLRNMYLLKKYLCLIHIIFP